MGLLSENIDLDVEIEKLFCSADRKYNVCTLQIICLQYGQHHSIYCWGLPETGLSIYWFSQTDIFSSFARLPENQYGPGVVLRGHHWHVSPLNRERHHCFYYRNMDDGTGLCVKPNNLHFFP